MAKKLFEKMITAVFPDRCLLCGKVVACGQLCCSACESDLPFLPANAVVPKKDDPFSKVVVPFRYEKGIRNAIIQMKFHSQPKAAEFFVPHMLDALNGCSADLVVPVPMAEHRRKERGYNQAELLAQPIAEALSAQYLPDVLVRTGSMAQHDLSANLRRLEANQSFSISSTADVADKTVLLVDDIFTTGSTLRRCAWLLKDAGAANVICVAAAAVLHRSCG